MRSARKPRPIRTIVSRRDGRQCQRQPGGVLGRQRQRRSNGGRGHRSSRHQSVPRWWALSYRNGFVASARAIRRADVASSPRASSFLTPLGISRQGALLAQGRSGGCHSAVSGSGAPRMQPSSACRGRPTKGTALECTVARAPNISLPSTRPDEARDEKASRLQPVTQPPVARRRSEGCQNAVCRSERPARSFRTRDEDRPGNDTS